MLILLLEVPDQFSVLDTLQLYITNYKSPIETDFEKLRCVTKAGVV